LTEREIIHIAVKSMGLDELGTFDPDKKIIEYVLRDQTKERLVDLTLTGFANKTASESVAPGGGSVSAYLGALGAALGAMVANLSSHKRGWDDRWEEFSNWAVKGQELKEELLRLVDADTDAFNAIIEAVRMPKKTGEEKAARKAAMDAATRLAINVPLQVMRVAADCMPLLEEMASKGNPASASDAGVGALAARAAVRGAGMNVRINLVDSEDAEFKMKCLGEATELEKTAEEAEEKILSIVSENL
jgi:glutamate formiminotransferase/formiminotetrahydrofolate cyclodeaminase